MPKISVIVPVYNKEQYIERTINSILSQTFRDFELIIINDGSTDFSEDIILKMAQYDMRIEYIKQINKGVSAARNTGIQLSKGKYITFLDSDDDYLPTFLEKMHKSIADKNVCYCGYYNITSENKSESNFQYFTGDVLTRYLKHQCYPNTNCWLIKRKYLVNHNIKFTEGMYWGEDLFFFSKILLHDMEIQYVEESLTTYYREIENSLSTNDVSKINNDIKWMKQLKAYIENFEKDKVRGRKNIRVLETYRIPASIIYRIKSNLGLLSKEQLRILFRDNWIHIKKIGLTNGLRSVKLIHISLSVWFNSLLKIK